MYEKNVMPEKQALNSQKGLFYPVSQQSLNEIADIFLCVCEVFRGKFRNDVLRGDILLLTYIEIRLITNISILKNKIKFKNPFSFFINDLHFYS